MRFFFLLIFGAIALILIVAGWYLLIHRPEVKSRRLDRFRDLNNALHRVDELRANYRPYELLGSNLAERLGDILGAYSINLKINADTDLQRLRYAEKAYAEVTKVINDHPPSVFPVDDGVSRKFVREVYGILHSNENPKESVQ